MYLFSSTPINWVIFSKRKRMMQVQNITADILSIEKPGIFSPTSHNSSNTCASSIRKQKW